MFSFLFKRGHQSKVEPRARALTPLFVIVAVVLVFVFGFQNCGDPLMNNHISSVGASADGDGTRPDDQGNNSSQIVEDTTLPLISILSPTSVEIYSTTQAAIALSGSASDNVGVSTVSWLNEQGGSGSAIGTESWSVVNLPLQVGENRITITAKDSVGNLGSATITITRKNPPSSKSHPFLIITEGDYPALRARAANPPWSSMKADAIATARNTSYDSSSSGIQTKAGQISSIVSAASLAYILDPDNKVIFKNKVRDTLYQWDDLYALRYTGWDFVVLAGIAFFNSVIAYDVVYNDLTVGERNTVEQKLALMGEWYMETNTNWQENLYPCRGIWALWTGDRAKFQAAKAGYRGVFNSQLSSDGVFTEGCGYSGGLGSLTTGTHFMDILEHLGEDSYYADPKVVRFQEWYFGYSKGPFLENCTFGDTFLGQGLGVSGAAFRAHRFSDKAGRYASRWASLLATPPGRLLNYVLLDQPLKTPERAPSRIFPDGGTWFHESAMSKTSLAAALWNITKDQHIWHTHKDINAIHLFGYGEHLLRNSGYNEAGQGALGFTWAYINNTAHSGNTVLINGKDHQSKIGAGIVEGFTGDLFDFATGDSGNALPNGKHHRSMVFVHPQDGKNGYFVLFDEVTGSSSSDSVSVILHPNSDISPVLTNQGSEYEFKVSPYPMGQEGVFLTVFLGTQPQSSNLSSGVLANGSKSFIGRYLNSNYSTDFNGRRNIVTVLYPHNTTHAKAKLTRVFGNGYSGATIDSGANVVDMALESTGQKNVAVGAVSFRGLATLYRTKSGVVDFYFVRKGKAFDDGVTYSRRGFESDLDVSIHFKGVNGRIVSPGTDLTIYFPAITGVKMNNQKITPKSSGNGYVKINVPLGTHSFTLLTAASP